MKKSNKLIQYLVRTGKFVPRGIPHYGGKQYYYVSEDEKEIKWFNESALGEVIYDMSDDDIEDFMKSVV